MPGALKETAYIIIRLYTYKADTGILRFTKVQDLFGLYRHTQVSLDERWDGFGFSLQAWERLKKEAPPLLMHTQQSALFWLLLTPTVFNLRYPWCPDVHIWEKLAGCDEGWKLCRDIKISYFFAVLHKDGF